MLHLLSPSRPALHGHWSRDLPPALTISPGDTVRLSTLDAAWCDGRPTGPWPWKRLEPRDPVKDAGHSLIGPIHIRSARPGQTLAVRIDALEPGDWAWTWSAPEGRRAQALGVAGHDPYGVLWEIDSARQRARDPRGRSVKLAPFLGVMGVAPPQPGIHSTTPPNLFGGNMDCRELVAGSTLFLPIGVEGALFSCGDGHGAQGDGEVCGNAIECPMQRVELTFDLLDRPLPAPRAKTPAGWITLGFGETLDRAADMAMSGMLDLIEELHGLPRQEALAFASLLVDLRITQVVNQTVGVHCLLRDQGVFE